MFFLPKKAFKGDVGTGCTEMLQKTWRFFSKSRIIRRQMKVEQQQKPDQTKTKPKNNLMQAHVEIDVDVSKNRGVSPQIIHFNRVFHYFHHPFWGSNPPIFGNTHVDIIFFYRFQTHHPGLRVKNTQASEVHNLDASQEITFHQ